MGIYTKILVVLPLVAFAVLIFGFGVYNTICKNSLVALFDC